MILNYEYCITEFEEDMKKYAMKIYLRKTKVTRRKDYTFYGKYNIKCMLFNVTVMLNQVKVKLLLLGKP